MLHRNIMSKSMKTINRRLVMAKDLNGVNKLFGGTILAWIDEQAYIEVISLLNSQNVVTKFISGVEFVSGATVGDTIDISTQIIEVGKTSITLKVIVSNSNTQKTIAVVDKIVMVNVDKNNEPLAHNYVLEETLKEITDF